MSGCCPLLLMVSWSVSGIFQQVNFPKLVETKAAKSSTGLICLGSHPWLWCYFHSGHRPAIPPLLLCTEDPHGKAGPRAHHSEGAENGEGAADPIRGSDCGGTSAEAGERSHDREGVGANMLVGIVSRSNVNVKMSTLW